MDRRDEKMKKSIWMCNFVTGSEKRPALSIEAIVNDEPFKAPLYLAITLASPRPDLPEKKGIRYEKGTKVFIWNKSDAPSREYEPLTIWLSAPEVGQILEAISRGKELSLIHAPYETTTIFSVRPSPEGVSFAITKKYSDGQKISRSFFIRKNDKNGFTSLEYIKLIQVLKSFTDIAWKVPVLRALEIEYNT